MTFNNIQQDFEDAIDNAAHYISKVYADKFVMAFKDHLKRFNLQNHTIFINSGMGSCCIMIKNNKNGKQDFLLDMPYYHSSPVWDELRFIEAQLGWDWCHHLNNVPLN